MTATRLEKSPSSLSSLFSHLHAPRHGGGNLTGDAFEDGRVDAHAAVARQALAAELEEDAPVCVCVKGREGERGR